MARPTSADMHIQRALSNVAIAYRNGAYIADQVFPNVPVQKDADKYFIFDKVAWFRNEAGPRAAGTRSREGGYSLSQGNYSAVEIAFSKIVTDEEEENADDPLMPRRTAVEFATDKILLNKEVQVADELFDNGSWSASATPGTTWDDPTSDPISDIEVAKETLVSAIGREPNVCVMGREVWTDLKRHPDLLDLYKYTRKGMITVADFSTLFEIPKVLVGTAIYASANTQDAMQYPSSGTLTDVSVTYSFVWDKNMWLGYVEAAPQIQTPTAGMVFVRGGREVATFRREEERATKYEVLEKFDVKVTSADSGYELIDCVA